jgi:hypothetical protein
MSSYHVYGQVYVFVSRWDIFSGPLMNYFGNGPKTEATGLLRQMEADVVAVLLERMSSAALLLLVSPSRPDGGTHHQAAAG